MEAFQERIINDGATRVLCSSDRATITSDWFSPGFWGARAQPVDAGGRGGAWFVDTPVGDVVLRQYRRGGLVVSLSERSYLFSGYRHTRSFAEYRLLQVLKHRSLPVPEPIAAFVCRNRLLTYRAAIIVRRIPDAIPLPEVATLQDTTLWRGVGLMIRRFHDSGLDHTDLNCDNILVTADSLYLIDFDKCRIRTTHGNNSAWKVRNLQRLKRSVLKRCAHLPATLLDQLWQALNEGYSR